MANSNVLIVRLSNNKVFDKKHMVKFITKAWTNVGSYSVSDAAYNALSVNFSDASDIPKVMHGGPWLFHGGWPLIMSRLRGGAIPDGVENERYSIVAHVHNLSEDMIDEEELRSLILFADVLEVQSHPSFVTPISKRRYVRVKLLMHVSQPIPMSFVVPRLGDFNLKVDLRYEWLPRMCLRCGLITHERSTCPLIDDYDMVSSYSANLSTDPGFYQTFLPEEEQNVPGADMETEDIGSLSCEGGLPMQDVEEYRRLKSLFWRSTMDPGYCIDLESGEDSYLEDSVSDSDSEDE